MAKMLSKQAAEPSALDPTASMLCLILANQPDLKLDNAALAPLLGLKDRKNPSQGRLYDQALRIPLRERQGIRASRHDTKDDEAKEEEVDEKPKPAKAIAASKGKKRSSSPEQDERVVNKKAKKAPTKKEIKAQEKAQKKDEEATKAVKAEAAAEEADKHVEKSKKGLNTKAEQVKEDVEEIKIGKPSSDEEGQDAAE